ncbi:MAG TPA: magnesium/cobalt transporter CorA [Longimicrobiaceae bacterium]|nr:magnesium/cobalt transporter CorA [Longimicrobiaceae bacterium]
MRDMRRRRPKPGTSPGTLMHDPEASPTHVRVIGYGPEVLYEEEVKDLSRVREMVDDWPVLWVHVVGLSDLKAIQTLGDAFGLHRLALEDVLNVGQRAKVEDYAETVFLVMRAPMMDPQFCTQQLSLFLGKGWVLTFQERPAGMLEPVRERIRHSVGRIRQLGADYLSYAVLDDVVDNYFPVLESYGEALDRMEEEVLTTPRRASMMTLHRMKRELMGVRRAVWPKREAVNALLRDPLPEITDDTRVYLRDCYDHLVQIMDLVETYRDLASSLTELYLSAVSNRMNEIMKVLTMFSAFFIPLSFIAGLWGMNFDHNASPFNMPELEWTWGYPFALTVMAAVAITLLVYFRRKGWIGGDD